LSTNGNIGQFHEYLFAGFLDFLMTKIDSLSSNRTRVWEEKEQKGSCTQCKCSVCVHRRSETSNGYTNRISLLPPIPRSLNRIWSVILNGKHSFTVMLPRPMIRMEGNHAYALPSECICTMPKRQAVVIFPEVNYELSLGMVNVKRESWRQSTSSPKIGMLVLIMHTAWSPNTNS
jgi:hypothetical protein